MYPFLSRFREFAWDERRRMFAANIVSAFLLVVLPAIGTLAAGRDLRDAVGAFPPVSDASRSSSFSPYAAAAVLLLEALLLAGIALLVGRPQSRGVKRSGAQVAPKRRAVFPPWGLLGGILLAAAWGIAWSRLPALQTVRRFTFAPLWFGCILVVNAAAEMLDPSRPAPIRRGRAFRRLFLWSAVFWWYFEWVNRFVRNWYYPCAARYSALGYFLHASICFSTVLPAVVSMCSLLLRFRFIEGFGRCRPLRIERRGIASGSLLTAGSLLMLGVGAAPDVFFPGVWAGPVLVLLGARGVFGSTEWFDRIGRGDWRPIVAPALAGFLCGVFWELWNIGSLEHWVYRIPLLDGWHIFAMPLPGYAGYLPFGIACVLVSEPLFPFETLCGRERGEG